MTLHLELVGGSLLKDPYIVVEGAEASAIGIESAVVIAGTTDTFTERCAAGNFTLAEDLLSV